MIRPVLRADSLSEVSDSFKGIDTWLTHAGKLINDSISYTDWRPVFGATGTMTYTVVDPFFAKYRITGDRAYLSLRVLGTLGGGAASPSVTFTPPTNAIPRYDGAFLPCFVNDVTSISGWCAWDQVIGLFVVRRYDGANWTLGATKAVSLDGGYEIL